MQYEYRCPKCKKRVVLRRPIADRDKGVSCECGENMQRILTLTRFPAIISDGTGALSSPRK